MTPSLSDDPYRYRWEGKLQAAGGNPYQVRPRDPPWAQLRDSAFPRVVGKDFKAVYGPLIEQVELWTYRVVSASVSDAERQVFWFKLPYALCDLAAIAAYIQFAKVPPDRGGWGIGHIGPVAEGIVVWFAAIPLLLLITRLIGERTER